MPNWCENVVTIKGSYEQIAALKEAADEGRFLDFLYPQPEGLMDDADKPQTTGAMPDWWNWRVENWGTKWEIPIGPNNEYDETSVTWSDDEVWISFMSAWAPPTKAYKHAVKNLGLDIVGYYYEPGMGFCGKVETLDGELDDLYINDVWEDEIPADIDDEFMITEQQRMDAELEADGVDL